MLVKLAYDAPSNAVFFPKIMLKLRSFSKLSAFGFKKCQGFFRRNANKIKHNGAFCRVSERIQAYYTSNA